MIKFVKKIQKSDEIVKRWWLLAFTTPVILLIVIAWIFYLKNSIISAAAPTDKSITVQDNGLWQKTTGGLFNSFTYFKNKIAAQDKFVINSGDRNFIWDDLESLPLRDLPQ